MWDGNCEGKAPTTGCLKKCLGLRAVPQLVNGQHDIQEFIAV